MHDSTGANVARDARRPRNRAHSRLAATVAALGLTLGGVTAIIAPTATGLTRAALAAPGDADLAPPTGTVIRSWDVSYGGFRALSGMGGTTASGGRMFGLDPSRTGPSGRARDRTAIVSIEPDLVRVEQSVSDALLQALDLADGRFGFAVGLRGAIARYQGARWLTTEPVTDVALNAVDLVGRTAGWAVGQRGTILRWDGWEWAPEPLPVRFGSENLTGVAALSPQTAWAVTDRGSILVRDAGGWRQVEDAPASEKLLTVAFRDPDLGVAAGDGVLVYEGGAWRSAEAPDAWFTEVAWTADGAYLLGDERAYRLQGNRVVPLTAGPAPIDLGGLLLSGLAPAPGSAPPTHAVAATRDGRLVRLSGGELAYDWPPVWSLTSLAVISDSLAFAGGVALTAGMVGASPLGAWTDSVEMPAGAVVQDMDMADRTLGWAVGERDIGGATEARVWRWQDGRWAGFTVEKTWRLHRVQVIDAVDAWATGNGVVARWDGTTWSPVPGAPPDATLGGLAMVEGGEEPAGWHGYFGGNGEIFSLREGEWSSQALEPPDAGIVHAIAAPAMDGAWAITSSALYRNTGEGWSEVDVPLVGRGAELIDIAASAIDDVWLLATPAGLLNWDGAGWTRHDIEPLGPDIEWHRLRVLRPVPGGPEVDAWLAGNPPTVARFRIARPTHWLAFPWLVR